MYLTAYILLILLVLVISTKKPSFAFAFYLSTFALEQWLQTRDAYFISNGDFVNIVNAAVLGYAFAVKFVKDRKVVKPLTKVSLLVYFLYIYALISTQWSLEIELSVEIFFELFPYILAAVIVAPMLISSWDDLNYTMWFHLIYGSIIMVLLYFFTDWGYRNIEIFEYSYAGNLNPLALANYSGYVLIAAFFLTTKKYKVLNYAKWLIIPVCFLVILQSGSRGQYLFLVLSIVIGTYYKYNLNKVSALFPLLFGLSFSVLVAYYVFNQFAPDDNRWELENITQDAEGRFYAASKLIDVWFQDPMSILFGLGSSSSYSNEIFGFYTHIVPLEILGELGLVGFGIFLSILFFTFTYTTKNINKLQQGSIERNTLITLFSFALFDLMLSFKQGSFLGSYVLFSMLIVLSRVNEYIRVRIG